MNADTFTFSEAHDTALRGVNHNGGLWPELRATRYDDPPGGDADLAALAEWTIRNAVPLALRAAAEAAPSRAAALRAAADRCERDGDAASAEAAWVVAAEAAAVVSVVATRCARGASCRAADAAHAVAGNRNRCAIRDIADAVWCAGGVTDARALLSAGLAASVPA